MKRNIFSLLPALLALLTLCLGSCSDEEIIFDHERPQFELKADAILLEVIMPQSTSTDEIIYIAGDFNGGEEVAANDLRWQLEKAQNSDVKWGIYLYPSDFVAGKSLADGFYFVSKSQGIERTVKNEDSMHTLSIGIGTRTNVTVNRWKAFFDKPQDPSEVTHDGYAIYVVDHTGWDELALYAWGDNLPELFGGWPGITATGSIELKGMTMAYFDTGEANKGLNYNLIFNNNGNNTQLKDFNVTLNRDYYLEITADGVSEFDPDQIVSHDGYAIFIDDQSGWDETALYAWSSDLPELFGGWPGALPTGSVVINGITYKYFDTGASHAGELFNFIFNNNNGGSQFDLAALTLDRDYYFRITDKAGTEIDPNNPEGGADPEPTPEPANYSLFVLDQTGWEATTVYAWGDKEVFGGWPGASPNEIVTIAGVSMKRYAMDGVIGESLNLIFNNNGGGLQLADFAITADKDYYLEITADGCKAIDRPTKEMKIYIDDQTGWEAIAVYAWGDKEMFGGWPGVLFSEKATVDGKEYKVITYTGSDEKLNLIFNNNGGGSQLNDYPMTASKDLFLKVTADGCSEIANE